MNPVFTEPDIHLEPGDTPEIPLPKGWTTLTLQAILHVIALARIVILNASNWPTVQAWYPDHVWSVDLTVVPSTDGLWVPWSPNALTQVHPYSWYVMVVIDHYSRKVMWALTCLSNNPPRRTSVRP
ncbi:MAG: hypothetical protein FWH27_06640 [Planctomycetaceae bacterium]|nr:hypothetical protein [Planctomycetaceae bacterium]